MRANIFHFVISVLLLVGFGKDVYAASLKTFDVQGSRVYLTLDDGQQVRVSMLEHDSVEVVYQANKQQLPSFALPENYRVLEPTVYESENQLTVQHNDVSVQVSLAPYSLAYSYRKKPVISEERGYFHVDSLRGFRFALKPDEKLYGGGQRVMGMDRRGQRMPLYNRAHYGYTTKSDQMYYSLPAVMSSANYAVIFDNSAAGSLDIGHNESDVLQFEARAGRSAYVVTLGDNLADVSKNVVSVTGRQPLPPRWALGNFASRFGYRNETQTRDVVNKFAEAEIPLDAVVLDLYWFGKDVKGHMGNLSWDRNAFPEPEKMMTDFADSGINTIVITEPFILTTSKQFENAVAADALAGNLAGDVKTFDFFFGNTALVDVFSEAGKDWFSGFYTQLHQQGVSGWWGDLGEPEVHPSDTLHEFNGRLYTADALHNAYGHQWAKMVYEHSLSLAPEQRPFVLMRSGFAGSQRFGMIPWTGDVSRSWGGLKPQVELALQMSVFGLAYTHSDLGGFAGGEVFDPQLYQRWLQLGVFQPVFRPHAQEDIAPEPVFHDEQTQRQAAELIRLRYRMLPYNYSMAIENSLTGMPLVRPLSFYHHDSHWFENKDSFYWGEQFLISPVTEPDVTEWKVDTPAGNWYHFFTGNKIAGGKVNIIPVTDTTFPVLVKAGAVVPMTDVVQSTRDADFSRLSLHVWAGEPGKSYEYTYFEDDGKAVDSIEKGEVVRGTITHILNNNRLSVNTAFDGRYDGMPDSRRLEWVLHGIPGRPASVMVEGQSIAVDSNAGVSWDEKQNVLRVVAAKITGTSSLNVQF
ncbi:TIM-barrel domain-containing protein [Alteromonas antoniana]|uniref:TIM-barrel domain-containing protein n=1 Tax=Alteromonas antoniana TaxID=2803813 RepID=UPI001C440F01|nr:TIM-barrel domain-containing protein [Alteromonas antoniana]